MKINRNIRNINSETSITINNLYAADIFSNTVRDMEDHGKSVLSMEEGFVDEFETANDMIDEAASSGFTYDSTDDLYS